MYCVIQEIKNKGTKWNGYYKEIEVYKSEIKINGTDFSHYSYQYAGGMFSRTINKSYKISIHKSYREHGKVKKKQWVLGTMDYYYIADFGGYIGDCCNLEEKAIDIGITEEELYNMVAVKLDPLIKKIQAEYEKTAEYKTHEKHEKILSKYQNEKEKFRNKYNTDDYDKFFDVFGVLRETKKFEEFKKSYEYKKEQERRYYENYNSNYNYSNSSSGYYISSQNNYTDKEKEYLKKIYRAAAVKLHPDIIKDDGEGMKFLNSLKDKWNI